MIIVARRKLKFLRAGRPLAITVSNPSRYRAGRTYALGVTKSAAVCHVEILSIDANTITVGLASVDPPHLLAARSEYGYTSDPAKAMHHEPEAVHGNDVERITAAARRTEEKRRQEATREMPLVARIQELERRAAMGEQEAKRNLFMVRKQIAAGERRSV